MKTLPLWAVYPRLISEDVIVVYGTGLSVSTKFVESFFVFKWDVSFNKLTPSPPRLFLFVFFYCCFGYEYQ